MAGYDDTRRMIISTLMGRPNGTKIQPENQQAYELNMLDYIRSLELLANAPFIGIAQSDTQPVQPDNSRACYISGVAQDRTVTFQNFRDYQGQPIQVTTSQMESYLVILFWNSQYWSAEKVPTNIISSAETAYFYYNYNIKKTYSSVSDMNSDSDNPIGIDGKYIKVGDLVTVVNPNNANENAIYSYTGSGWQFQSGYNFELSNTFGDNPNNSITQKTITEVVCSIASHISGIPFDISGRLQYDGTFQSSATGLFRTDFVDVSKIEKISVLGYSSNNNPPDSNGTACLAFYDVQRNFINSIYGDENKYVLKNVEVPENAYYCVACGHPGRSFLLKHDFIEVEAEIDGLRKDTTSYKGGNIAFNAQSGYINNSTGAVTSSTASFYAIIDVTNLTRVDYNASQFIANAGYLFKDENGVIIQTKQTTVTQREQVDVPEGAAQMYISWHSTLVPTQQVSGYIGITASEKFVEIDDRLDEVEKLIKGFVDFSNFPLPNAGNISTIDGSIINTSSVLLVATEDYIYCKGALYIDVTMNVGTTSANTGNAFYDENKEFISGNNRPVGEVLGMQLVRYPVPENASYFRTQYYNAEYREIYGDFSCKVYYAEPFDLDTAPINLKELLSYRKLSGYINNSTGNVVSSSISYHAVINVVDLTSITFQTSIYVANAGYLFKDENGVIINAVHTTTKSVITVDIPENAVEFYVSWRDIDDDTQQIYIKQKTTIPDKFVEVDKAIQELSNRDTTKRRYYVIGNPDVIVTEAPSSGQISVLSDLYAVYDNLVATYPNFVSKEELGADEWNNMIYCYTFKKPNPQQRNTGFSVIDWDNNVANMTILINSGIHGNEKRAATSTSRMAELLCSSEDAAIKYIRNNATVKIIPCLNPSGFIANTRENGNGVDINRDFVARTQIETNICCDFIDANADNAVGMIDCHNFIGTGLYALFVMRQDLVEFRQIVLPIGIALEDNWKNFLPDRGKPYIDPTNANATTMKDYMFEKGIPGLSVETPTTDSVASAQNSIKMAVDMYFNVIVAFIKNNS